MNNKIVLSNRIEKLLWSIALPGFGQLLNHQYVKGVTLLILEFIINVKSHLNDVIIHSFHGEIQQAIANSNYQWLMFYPCLYMFAIYDAYKNGSSEKLACFAYVPTAMAAFLATVGLTYSAKWQLFGLLLGPVWLTMLFCFLGLGIGYGLTKWLQTYHSS